MSGVYSKPWLNECRELGKTGTIILLLYLFPVFPPFFLFEGGGFVGPEVVFL